MALGLRGIDEELIFSQCTDLFEKLNKNRSKGITISDPHPDVNPKLRDKYRFTILLKGKSVKNMLALIKTTLKTLRRRGTIVTVNVDP